MAARRSATTRHDGIPKKKANVTSTPAGTVGLADSATERSLRISRPYGGAIVFETRTNDAASIETYFAFVRAWFDARGNQLPLLDDGQEGIRELAAANTAATSAMAEPTWAGTMRYESSAPKHAKPNLPPPIAGDTYPTLLDWSVVA